MAKHISDYYYFGCKSSVQKGHYLHLPKFFFTQAECWLDLPKQWQRNLDGTLCHRGQQQVEGWIRLHHLDGWTAIAFWDRSADHRPNSNSVFLAFGEYDAETMVALGKEQFPEVFNRFPFQLSYESAVE